MGEVWAPNLTAHPQAGIGAWSDGQLARLLRNGVGRDGRYAAGMPRFARLSNADVAALIGFLALGRCHGGAVAERRAADRLRHRGHAGAGLCRGRGHQRRPQCPHAGPRPQRRLRPLPGHGGLRLRRLPHRRDGAHRGEVAVAPAAGGRHVPAHPPRRAHLLGEPDAGQGNGAGRLDRRRADPGADHRHRTLGPAAMATHAGVSLAHARRGCRAVRLPALGPGGLAQDARPPPRAAHAHLAPRRSGHHLRLHRLPWRPRPPPGLAETGGQRPLGGRPRRQHPPPRIPRPRVANAHLRRRPRRGEGGVRSRPGSKTGAAL